MLNNDKYNSDLMLTHEQATNCNDRSKDYQAGYRQGYWHQPEEEPENPDYMEGYAQGWNNRSSDGN
ncbi:hypothetical protein [Microcoleus sp. N9_B4]|uniref:hypothetical protein n=1 Tax=Microcoleus sp. N9_B4 TaxID=3055386 RepID=UPI002FD20801